MEVISNSEKKVLSLSEAAKYLSVSKSLLYKMTSGRKIDFFKPNNGKIFFKKCSLDSWVLQGERPSIDALAIETSNYLKGGEKKNN